MVSFLTYVAMTTAVSSTLKQRSWSSCPGNFGPILVKRQLMMAAATASSKEEPVNIVHRNEIFCETVRKEQRHQKLYTNYGVNPYKKMHVVAGKPNSLHDSADGAEDEEFLKTYKRAQSTPQSKFEFPQTEAQEIGWDTKPLIDHQRHDRRLHHPHCQSEVTKYMEVAWRQKEQATMQE